MKTYPEGGYGWVIVVSAGTSLGLSTSILKCMGQIYASLLQTTSYSRSQVASVVVLPSFISLVLAVFAVKLAELYSFKLTLFLGSFLLGFGVCLSSFTTYNLGVFTFTFMIIGLGMTLGILPCTVITGLYFTKKRPLAMGITVAIAGAWNMIMPIILQYFLDTYHLEGAMLLWGGIMLQGCVTAMLIRQPTWALQKQGQNSQPESKSKEDIETFLDHEKQQNLSTISVIIANVKMILKQLIQDSRHFRKCVFLLQLGNRTAFFFSLVSVALILPQFAMEQIEGITSTQIALLLSVTGVPDIFSRLIGGWINNHIRNRTATYLFALFCLAITVLVFQFTNSYPAILAVCLLFGMFNGYIHVTYFVVMFDTFGPADTAGAIALHFVIKGFVALTTGPIVAMIRDLTGSYRHCFTVAALILILSVVLWLFKRGTLHTKQKKSNLIQTQK